MSDLTWAEIDAELQPAHIADYAYPPGDWHRYTLDGWQLWVAYCIAMGWPVPMDALKHTRGGG